AVCSSDLKISTQQEEAPHRSHSSRDADDAEAYRRVFVRLPADRGTPLEERVNIRERLRRMLVATVAAADDGNPQRFGHLVYGILVAVAQDHEIAVAVQHFAYVFQAFALCDAGRRRVGYRHDVAAEPVSRAFEGPACAGARCVKSADEDVAGERPRR